MPDQRLLSLAAEGRLNDGEVLAAEVDRMLNDSRSAALFEQFAGQWLGTHEVGRRTVPDTGRFKGQFSTALLMDMRQEPSETLAYIVREDRPLTDLIDADYAVINRRLAKHYGLMGDDKGDDERDDGAVWPKEKVVDERGGRGKEYPFRRVDLPDRVRGGVLGFGGVHLASSYPNRTSAVLRGAWVLETLLGTKVPSPPPGVPELKKKADGKKLTPRQSLELHRQDPTCAACHNLMDPLGYALDGFDVLGRSREEVDGEPLDLSAALPDGTAVDGPEGLKTVLLKRKDRVLEHLTRRLLGYALGRSLVDGDDCTVQRIAEAVRDDGYSSRTLFREVVLSVPFRYVDR